MMELRRRRDYAGVRPVLTQAGRARRSCVSWSRACELGRSLPRARRAGLRRHQPFLRRLRLQRLEPLARVLGAVALLGPAHGPRFAATAAGAGRRPASPAGRPSYAFVNNLVNSGSISCQNTPAGGRASASDLLGSRRLRRQDARLGPAPRRGGHETSLNQRLNHARNRHARCPRHVKID
jgi:hypothetical protein